MKNLLYVFGIVGVLFMTTSATCNPNDTPEPELNSYTCKCVYVPSDTTLANKEETSTFKSQSNTTAIYDCNKLSGNYVMQGYSGSCNLQ